MVRIWGHVVVSVTRIHVQLSIAVDIPGNEAVHDVVVWKEVGHLRERVVAIVPEKPIISSSVNEVDEAIVVKVVQLGLQEKPVTSRPLPAVMLVKWPVPSFSKS